ncbi:Lipid II:glycine glycyltransferase (Peptidoglycan interpeptide bridge formation enzyme) [Streptomyces aidingensis]|uniref:Lipid II:glycine glycyltransferase (Peptidoglycan interpeptide bridge formation enzyme) n=2 Tax=Streptomyces aidingensis TaxID=910347 RepID=A0A1I1STK8_9ACTN|nr:Lipid II:glycine glycyltransferase (Peptidoglycan interpeptide bridge formation enzyme) [Streptomyces aidingensis]
MLTLTSPPPATRSAAALDLDMLTTAEHLAFLRGRRARTDAGPGQVSFLQTPAWARVKQGWLAESLGWRDERGLVVGAALVLYRRLPHLRRSFAYLPEGPVIDWSDPALAGRWLAPLLEWLRGAGAFAVRMGPPLAYRHWTAATLKAATGPGRRIGDVLPDLVDPLGAAVADRLRDAGWRRCAAEDGGDAQPRLVFEVPLAGRRREDLWAGLNQEWRRNVRKAAKSGVVCGATGPEDLPVFHELLGVTERRDGFRLGRSLAYFQRQYEALNAEEPDRMRLYTARHEGRVLAAHTMVRAADGSRIWYQTGASADLGREVRPSNGLQWRMLCDAHELGASVYDMRGIPDTLDPADRAHGLLRWKLGTGGRAVEMSGEWELPLDGALDGVVNRTLLRAMHGFLARR